MRKILLNKCYGGFSVSRKAYELYAKKKGFDLFIYKLEIKTGNLFYIKTNDDNSLYTTYTNKDLGDVVKGYIADEDRVELNDTMREDETLIEVVEELGAEANSKFSSLVIVKVPESVAKDYVIDNYDGIETLHKRVQIW